jgi:hypothetical protein
MPLPTPLVVDGFEHGLAGQANSGPYDVTTGSPTIVTTPVRTGSRALEISSTVANEYVQWNISSLIAAGAGYIHFESLPSAVVTLVEITNPNGLGAVGFNNATGKVRLTIGAAVPVDVGPVLTAGPWYRVVFEFDTSADPAVLRARIDGGTEGTTSRAQVSLASTGIRLGQAGAQTVTAYYDDWMVSTTDGDYELVADWAQHSVPGLSPTADGTHNITTSGDFDGTTTQFTNATTDSYLNIDDVPLNISNTDGEVIRQDLGTTSEYMEHTYADLPAGTDVPVDVRVYDYDTDGGAAGGNLAVLKFLLSDGTPVTDVRLSSDDPGLTVTLRRKMLSRPAGDWSRDHVNGLKSQWGFSDADPDPILLGVVVEVLLMPAPPAQGASFPARRSIVG